MRRIALFLPATLVFLAATSLLGCKKEKPATDVAARPQGDSSALQTEDTNTDSPASLPKGAKLLQVTPTISVVVQPDADLTPEALADMDLPAYPDAELWRPNFALSEEHGFPIVVALPGLDDEVYGGLLEAMADAHIIQTTADSVDDVRASLEAQGGWSIRDVGEAPDGETDAMGELNSFSSLLGGQVETSQSSTLQAMNVTEGLLVGPDDTQAFPMGGSEAVIGRTADDAETFIIGVDGQALMAAVTEVTEIQSQASLGLLEEIMADEKEAPEVVVAEEPVEGDPVTLIETEEGFALTLLPAAPIPESLLDVYALNGVFQYQSYRIDGGALTEALNKAMAEAAKEEPVEEMEGFGEMMAGFAETLITPMVEGLTKHAYVLAVDSPLERVRERLTTELLDWRVGNIATQDEMRQFPAVSKTETINGSLNVFEGPDERSYIVIADQKRMMRDMFSGLGAMFGGDTGGMGLGMDGEAGSSTFDMEWDAASPDGEAGDSTWDDSEWIDSKKSE